MAEPMLRQQGKAAEAPDRLVSARKDIYACVGLDARGRGRSRIERQSRLVGLPVYKESCGRSLHCDNTGVLCQWRSTSVPLPELLVGPLHPRWWAAKRSGRLAGAHFKAKVPRLIVTR